MQKNLLVELTKLGKQLEDTKNEERKVMVLETGLLQIMQYINDGEISEPQVGDLNILDEIETFDWMSEDLLVLMDEVRSLVFNHN